jgi:hypothetical protein
MQHFRVTNKYFLIDILRLQMCNFYFTPPLLFVTSVPKSQSYCTWIEFVNKAASFAFIKFGVQITAIICCHHAHRIMGQIRLQPERPNPATSNTVGLQEDDPGSSELVCLAWQTPQFQHPFLSIY